MEYKNKWGLNFSNLFENYPFKTKDIIQLNRSMSRGAGRRKNVDGAEMVLPPLPVIIRLRLNTRSAIVLSTTGANNQCPTPFGRSSSPLPHGWEMESIEFFSTESDKFTCPISRGLFGQNIVGSRIL